MGSLHKARNHACYNSKEEKSWGLWFYSNNYFTEFENVVSKVHTWALYFK